MISYSYSDLEYQHEAELKYFKVLTEQYGFVFNGYCAFLKGSKYYLCCIDVDCWEVLVGHREFDGDMEQLPGRTYYLIDIEEVFNDKNAPIELKKIILFNLDKFN